MSAAALHRRAFRPRFTLSLVFACLVLGAAPAAAQVGATVSGWSEERLRGYSLSAGHPVARVDLSYDEPSGFYGAISGSVVYSNEYHLRPLGVQENIGFAKQLGNGPTFDVGLHDSRYSRYSSEQRSTGYTELYAGLIGKILSTHLYVSPNYFYPNTWRGYGEVEASVRPRRHLMLSSHLGASVPLNDNRWRYPTQYDWRVGAAQEIGRLSLHLDLGGGGPGKDYYDGKPRGRTALVAGASFVF